MKESRRQGKNLHSLWKDLTSGILDKVNTKRNNISEEQYKNRDMRDAHTPISRLDLTGMNRQQAKELIGKVIDERLEMISHLEMPELKIDYREKERQRAKAAERINERRNRRKQRNSAAVETIVTEQGIYSNFKQTSIFDILQPESFPEEDPCASVPIEGQLSIMDAIAAKQESEKQAEPAAIIEAAVIVEPAAEPEPEMQEEPVAIIEQEPEMQAEPAAIIEQEPEEQTEPAVIIEPAVIAEYTAEPAPHKPFSFDLFRMIEEEPKGEPETAAENSITEVNTSLDESVDKVFAFYERNKDRVVRLCQKIHQKTGRLLIGRIAPAVRACGRQVNGRLAPLFQKLESRLQLKNKVSAVQMKLAAGEKRTAEKFVPVVDCLDRWNDALLHRMEVLKNKICHRVNQIRDYAEHHKKLLLIEFGGVVAAAAVVTIIIGNMTAYEYIYNGKVLGVVKNQEDVYKTIDIIGDKLSVQYEADITIDKEKDIRFNKVVAFSQDIDDQEDILNRLTYMRDMKANGRGIYIEGKLMAVLESEKTAKAILNEIQNKFLKENDSIEYKKVGFAEDVAIKDVETKLGNIEPKEKVLEYMMTGAVEQRIHLVQSGETFSEIAKMYGMKQSELQATNPDVVPEKLHIGQEICLNQIVPLVTVQTTEVAQYIEPIPYEIQYENTANLYKNEQTVKSRGTNGEKDVIAEIVRNNGIEVSRKEISSTILSQPVSQVVLVGTKEPPPLIGTGSFIYPIRGTLTSRYGTRWGRLHSGIDLAAPTGTHIKAADGGKVTFSGYNGALGYMVAIDHGGGRVTWYGHCSKLFVKKGERVYQGQHIANVGNTGRSTGPHVHFEVHINGKTKNPLNYL